jgi:hypothetical protein
MRRSHLLGLLGALGVAALVVGYVLVPALRGQPLLLAAVLGGAGVLTILIAVGATLPPRARSIFGWFVFAAGPVAMLVWVFTVGIPPGVGAIALGGLLCLLAVAGLVLAVREVRV